jgi:hypothetical protein
VGPRAGLVGRDRAGRDTAGLGRNQLGIHALNEVNATFDLVRRRMRMNKMITARTTSRTVRNEEGNTAK